MQRKCTIKDIAAIAGVSQSTVSRVLRNDPCADVVSAKTRQKIHDAVKQLGYVPNVNAQRLTSQRTGIIGIVMPEHKVSGYCSALQDRIFSEILGGIEAELRKSDYRVLLIVDDQQFREQMQYIKLFQEQSLDGMLIWGARLQDTHWSYLKDYPVIQIGGYSQPQDIPFVGIDNFSISRDITRTILANGRKRILYLGGNESLSPCQERRRGCEAALLEAGIKPDFKLFPAAIDNTVDTLSPDAIHILEHGTEKFDAVQCLNDGVALICGRLLLKLGYKIPQDILISGGDRLRDEYHELVGWRFPLLTFEVDGRAIGELAVQRLLHGISKKHISQTHDLLSARIIQTEGWHLRD